MPLVKLVIPHLSQVLIHMYATGRSLKGALHPHKIGCDHSRLGSWHFHLVRWLIVSLQDVLFSVCEASRSLYEICCVCPLEVGYDVDCALTPFPM